MSSAGEPPALEDAARLVMTGTAVLTSPTAPPQLRTVPRRDLSWRGWRLDDRVDLMRWGAPMAAALCWAGTAV